MSRDSRTPLERAQSLKLQCLDLARDQTGIASLHHAQGYYKWLLEDKEGGEQSESKESCITPTDTETGSTVKHI